MDAFCQFFLCYKLLGFELGKAFLICCYDGRYGGVDNSVEQAVDLLFDLGDIAFQRCHTSLCLRHTLIPGVSEHRLGEGDHAL
ncbi:MAG: hypothetical protein QNJ16_13115 [Rhodobacter sp.]|nr:hypothetical protein [Rhodobacter sp.]